MTVGEGSQGSSVLGDSLVSVNTEMAATLRGRSWRCEPATHSEAGMW